MTNEPETQLEAEAILSRITQEEFNYLMLSIIKDIGLTLRARHPYLFNKEFHQKFQKVIEIDDLFKKYMPEKFK